MNSGMNTSMKILLVLSLGFLLYVLVRNKFKSKPKSTTTNNVIDHDIANDKRVLTKVEEDIDSNLYVKVSIDDDYENVDLSMIGYEDFIKISDNSTFHQEFLTSLKESLDYKESYYRNLRDSTEPVVDSNHNDIASRLSCNNTIISNANEILEIIAQFKALIKSPKFDISNRFNSCRVLLSSIVGRDDFKDMIVRDIIVFSKSQRLYANNFNNVVMSGPPGCGKSYCVSVASDIYNILGITLRPSKEITMEDLANGYVNESSRQTRNTLINCLERIVLFDEAYILTEGNGLMQSNNNEVMTTIVQFLSEYSGKINLIIAGYESSMNMFLKANQGNERRFPTNRRILFSEYSPRQLTSIFISHVHSNDESIKFVDRSVSYLYTLIYRYKDKFTNGAGDMVNISRSFIEYCHLNKSHKWSEANYDSNAWILNTFFISMYGNIEHDTRYMIDDDRSSSKFLL